MVFFRKKKSVSEFVDLDLKEETYVIINWDQNNFFLSLSWFGAQLRSIC